MQVSVIIPTFNRAEVLRLTLQGYARQTEDHRILELLVMDDGSRDNTRSVVEECTRTFPFPLRYLHHENSGLSAARNHAFREARGEIVLFGDDDIIPGPDMVAEHVTWHRKYPEPEVGVLGYVTWAAAVHPTPFMKWSGEYGPQFNFGYFTHGQELDFRHGYFCNTTVKASFLREHGVFDERLRKYGYEDLELSYRLGQKGYRLRYNQKAIGYHHKHETFEATRKRIENLHQAWPTFEETAAGKRFLELLRARWQESDRSKSVVKRLLKPLKGPIMPLVRPLADSRFPLPDWLYDMMFYHYVTPLSEYIRSNHPEFQATGAKSGR